jgi:Gamma-glutamyl cyclotransferase, AIG2-like
MLHFAYGTNMSRALMRRRCPNAAPLGIARLAGWRFLITRDGYASVTPAPGDTVHGVLWHLQPRDLAALNAYESLDSGLYARRRMSIAHDGRRVAALVFVARETAPGRPKPGYQDIVVAAAREWQLPESYVGALERWLPGHAAARAVETGDVA